MELTQEQLDERASILEEGYQGKGWEHVEESDETTPLENQPEAETTDGEESRAEVPQEFLDTLEAMKQKIDSYAGLEDRLRKSESRVGNLYQELNKQKESTKVPSPEEIEAAAKEKEMFEEMEEDVPGFNDVIGLVEKRIEGKIPDIESIREGIESDFNQRLSAVNKTVEERIVSVAHKDWVKTVSSEEFQAWAGKQTGEEVGWLQSDKAEDVIMAIDSFKNAKIEQPADIKKQREKQLELAVTQKTSSRAVKTKTEADMTPSELRRHLVKQGYKEE